MGSLTKAVSSGDVEEVKLLLQCPNEYSTPFINMGIKAAL
jgi:hypothetical protein